MAGRSPLALLGLALLALTAVPTLTAATTVGTLYTSVSVGDVQGLLDAMMLTNERAYGDRSTDGGPAWQIPLGNTEAVLFLDDCEGPRCTSVQLWAGYQTPEPTSLAVLNDWNRGHRFSRAYRSVDGVTHLEAELDLAGGAPIGAVVEFIRTFRASSTAFSAHLADAVAAE